MVILLQLHLIGCDTIVTERIEILGWQEPLLSGHAGILGDPAASVPDAGIVPELLLKKGVVVVSFQFVPSFSNRYMVWYEQYWSAIYIYGTLLLVCALAPSSKLLSREVVETTQEAGGTHKEKVIPAHYCMKYERWARSYSKNNIKKQKTWSKQCRRESNNGHFMSSP